MIYDDYIAYCHEYTSKYGDKTVVFIQIGDFFELYAVMNEHEKMGADIYTVCDLCNIVVSRKNKTIVENSRSNPLMAGFPLSAIAKFVQIMINNGYTCVIIRQVSPPPNPKREVTELISPSTTLNVSNKEGLFLMVVYWETIMALTSVAIATIDLTTGNSSIYEASGSIQDPDFAKDEVVRYTNLYQPKEVVYIGSVGDGDGDIVKQNVHYRWKDEDVKPFLKPSYQNLILEKVFGKTGVISPLEALQLDRYTLAPIAYCYMIQFAYEHNEEIIKNISHPIHLKNTKHLVLEANCIYQLNIDSQNPTETPLIRILNRTVTAFGSRMFRDYLFNPIVDKADLEERYDRLALFQTNGLYKEVSQLLQPILDIERLIRKIGMGKFAPAEWISLASSMESAQAVFKVLKEREKYKSSLGSVYKATKKIMNDYTMTLDLEECGKYGTMADMNTSIFNIGVHPDIDEITTALQRSFAFLDDLRLKITNVGSGETTLCRLDCNEREGYHLTITKKRWELVQQLCPTHINVGDDLIKWNECNVKPISASSSMLRLSHQRIDTLSDAILINQCKISNLNLKYYKSYQTDFYDKYHTNFSAIVKELGEIDIYSTNAKNATEYKYSRPIIESDASSSHITIKGLRHPIIERLNNSVEYVSNDVAIGFDKKGLLLYGINASGKSSLMKSVGINVIMAQAGMFVAASECTLVPYHHLFTRISGADNIYRGLSTFTVEMLELKNILNRCDANSLILGDELCAGTECVSAVAIVASGIEYLLHNRSSFIFATHLHELLDIGFITASTDLSIQHLHISMDEKTGKIIYDRKLKAGNGSKIYGLEVCRFLKMSDRFLEKANVVRKTMLQVPTNLVEPKLSKYNSEIYVADCILCGKRASETHHIRQQKDADDNGYIGDIHKDAKANLIVLCEACHLEQHNGRKKIEKVVMTSDGVEHVIGESGDEPLATATANSKVKDLLHYTIQGWKYRYKPTDTWKKLIPSNYEKVFAKLMPLSECPIENISMWLVENQSEFLSFVK